MTFLIHGYKVKKKPETEMVKRYNEKTGEPCQKRVVTGNELLCIGEDVINIAHPDEHTSGDEIKGLTLIAFGDTQDPDWFLCVILGHVETGAKEISMPDNALPFERIISMTDQQPKIYLAD